MSRLVLISVGLLCSLQGALGVTNEFSAPREGGWAGFDPGTWMLRKFTTREPGKPPRTTYHKTLLIGESPQDGPVYVSGAAGEAGAFLKKPGISRNPPWRRLPSHFVVQEEPGAISNRQVQVSGERSRCRR